MSISLSPGEALFFRITFWIINGLITIVSFLFILSFIKLRERSIGMYMILVLTISDFSFPLMNMVTVGIEIPPELDGVFYHVAVVEFCFSLYWSTVIALFSYKILAAKAIFNSTAFFWKALLTCFLCCAFCPLLMHFEVLGIHIKSLGPGFSTVGFRFESSMLQQLAGWVLFDMIGMFSPIFLIYYCYHNVYKALKVNFNGVIEYAELSSSRVFVYVIIPVFCFLPWELIDLYTIITGEEMSFTIILLACIFRRAWGFLNLLAYWFLSPGYTGGRYSDADSDGADEVTDESSAYRTESFY